MNRITRVDVVLLSAAILLTSATQLRPLDLPIGPGEVLLAVWIGWRFLVLGLNPVDAARLRPGGYLAAFWTVFFALLIVSLAVAYARGTWDESGAARDMIAYMLSAAFSACLAHAIATNHDAAVLMRKLFGMAVAVLLALFVLAASRRTFLGVDPWYGAIRFTGWSTNPNQLGLLLSPLPFLALWAMPWRAGNRLKLAAGLTVLLLAGLLCRSDALYLSWLIAGTFLAFAAWLAAITRRGATGGRAFLFVALLPGLALGFIVWASTGLVGDLVGKLVQVYELGGQGSLRLLIWTNGYQAFAESPLIGHGPGAFSGAFGPFQSYESHNTLIDVATQTGLVGLATYLSFLAIVHLQLLRAREYALLAAVISITVFSLFHFVLRHPVFWTVMTIGLHVAWERAPVIFPGRWRAMAPQPGAA